MADAGRFGGGFLDSPLEKGGWGGFRLEKAVGGFPRFRGRLWIPACAGMTAGGDDANGDA